jgi:predicted ATPase/transcriptional regulator with XRE-family HTH domain
MFPSHTSATDLSMDEMDFQLSFGEWIKRRRKELDLTQAELAQRASCSLPALRKIEAGERRPSKQLAGLLAKSLEIPSEDQTAFIRAARGELNVERLHTSAHAPSAVYEPGRNFSPSSGNLPGLLTPFIGRELELASLGQLLSDPQCQLLTLVGPGGIGKTRLAIEVAAHHRDNFPDGVWFVPLAPLSSSDYLIPAIADALNFRFQGPTEPQAQLVNYLHNKSALLVLDNAEHLLDGVGSFAEILKSSGQLKLLITSRERLNLLSEWVFEIQGLPVPPNELAEQFEEYSSVALFLQSARRIKSGFEVLDDERRWVVDICRLLEGMPLGIELAAGWVSLLTLQEIKDEIERDLSFLTSTFRDIPERHRSLWAVFDHSWNLLSPSERRVLCRLSVFRGGFTREAAQIVADASLSLLSSLFNKSLLRKKEGERYDLHETIRLYAGTHLAENQNEEELARQHHSTYYLDLVYKYKTQLASANQKLALSVLNSEIDNLRLAWDWAVEHRRLKEIRQSLDALWRFYTYQSSFQEGIPVFEKVVKAFLDDPTGDAREPLAESLNVIGQALAKQGWFNFRLGRLESATQMLRQSIDMVGSLDDQPAMAFSLISLGGILAINYDDPQGNVMLMESLDICHDIGDPWLNAISLANMAIAALTWRGYQEAQGLFRDAVAQARVAGDPAITAFCLTFSGLAAFSAGKLGEAHDLISESLAMSRACENRWDIATALSHLGQIACAQGQYLIAQERFRESIAIFEEQGELLGEARALIQYGEAALALCNFPEARRSLQAGLRLAMENQALPIALASLFGLASLLAREGKSSNAVQLLTRIRDHPASEKETKERSARLLTDLKSQLTSEQAVSSLSQNMPFETLLATILSDGIEQYATDL